jgi:hypothetical protein
MALAAPRKYIYSKTKYLSILSNFWYISENEDISDMFRKRKL